MLKLKIEAFNENCKLKIENYGQQVYTKDMEASTQKKNRSRVAYFIILAGSISFLIAFPTIVLLLVGMGLDAWLNKSPLFTIGGAITGFLSSFVNIYRLLKRLQ